MVEQNQQIRTGPGPTDLEVHARIRKLRVSISPHPSKMLQRGGNVFPLVSKSRVSDNNPYIDNESK